LQQDIAFDVEIRLAEVLAAWGLKRDHELSRYP
jgi:hypothetical protein